MDFKVLAVGDVVGNPGMDRVCRCLRQLKRQTGADFVTVCGENASVVGMTPQQGEDILDAGADVVIGAHSHCLQGMEYYDGKPIIYSLGNYWFNEKTLDTMLLELHFFGDDTGGELEVRVIPAIQSDYCTEMITEPEEQERLYSFLEDISVNVQISEDGIVSKKE